MASSKYELLSYDYELLDLIKEGSFAKVWMCKKQVTIDIVAAKIYQNDTSASREVGHFVDFDVCLIDCTVRSTVSST